MIDDLDKTIATLLRREMPFVLSEQVQISFEAPDSEFPSQNVTTPAINLFLYDVRENLELRSNDVYVEARTNGTAIRTRAPVRVDFSYLITAWASDTVPNPAADEHRLLGEVMRVLLRWRSIPADVLQGVLAGHDPRLPVSTLQPGRLQSIGEFWQALGGRPKTSLNYLVTLAIDVAAPEEVPLVTETILKIRSEEGARK